MPVFSKRGLDLLNLNNEIMRKVLLFCMAALCCLPGVKAQLNQTFDNPTFPPTGWLNVHTTGADVTAVWERATAGALLGDDLDGNPVNINPKNGAGMAQFRSYDFPSGNGAHLITSAFSLTSGGPHQVKFWMYRDITYTSQDSVSVYINTAANTTGAAFLGKIIRKRDLAPAESGPDGWYQYTFLIPAGYNTATNYIVFSAVSRFGNNMFIDEVVVESQPSCLNPQNLAVSGITNNAATVSWDVNTGASGYQWAVTTSATPPASGTATSLTSVNATGLTSNTVYYAHVRSNCGGTFSSWSTLSFTTAALNCSTAEVISGCGVSKSVSLTGTGVYNVTSCGFSTPGNEKLYSFTPSITGNYTLNITASNGEYIDYFYKNAAGGCSNTGWICIDDNDAVGTDVFGPLTAGTTYYILLDPEDATVSSNHTFQLDCPAASPPPCTTNLTPANGATGVSPVVLTWNAATGATGYNVFFGTTNPPTTNVGSTATTTSTITGTAAGTTYYWYVQPTNTAGGATGCQSSTFSFTTAAAPVNDTVCGAISLTLGGPQDCKNTTTATSADDPALPGSCSSPNNTVWYTYTPAANGTVLARLSIPGATTNALNGWVAWYTATGSCPAPGLTLTPVAGSACAEFGQTGAGDVDSLSSPVLTAGTTYYIMIDGFFGDAGEFCINLIAPPPPPPCVTNLTPANGATSVTSVAGNVTLTWNAAAGASSYDLYFGTTNPPTNNIGNIVGTTAGITGTSYNTVYYWYVTPRNIGGGATGCTTNTTSFTTENPANCTPSYTTGCSQADSISYFSLKGNTGTVIYNPSGATCNTSPVAYSDYTAAFTPVTLTRTESYGGFIKTGDANDYISMWIDGDDDGYFEDNERILNNLKGSLTKKLYSVYIPAGMPLGNHRLRVRAVYFGTAPTTPTHPCNPYTWGETEDYLVTITNVGTSRNVSTGTPGSCIETSAITVDAASNNNMATPLHLLDSLNNYVAGLYPNGNNLFNVTSGLYVHNGPVRQDVSGRYYMDRNIHIAVEYLPTNPYNLRYFYRNSELNALIAQPGSGVISQFDLVSTKTLGAECVTQYVTQSPTIHNPTGFGSLSGDRFIDFTNITGFSRFFLHGGSTVLLPVTLVNLRGEVTGSSNTVYWTTTQEQNNAKFIVERSANGRDYSVAGELNSRAVNGNSSTPLNYRFEDATPPDGKAYYRIRIVDLNSRKNLSPTITVLRGKGVFEIVDVRPNPTNGKLNFNIAGNIGNSGLTVVVRSINGKEVMRKNLVQTNRFEVDMSALTGGLYLLEAIDVKTGDKAMYKVVKE
jgi:hypothetical protein